MATETNRYGLSRYIPADILRAVRRECGYGCVICGLAVAQYEHFDPPFEDARSHTLEGIAFLCGGCHDKKTRGVWSVEKIAAARLNPITFRNGCARDVLDISPPFTLWIGNSSVKNVSTVVRTRDGDSWFAMAPPEEAGGPMRISAKFFSEDGAPSLVIDNNEWSTSSSQWDIEVVGGRIVVRSSPDSVALQLLAVPPHALRLERLRMRREDISILVDQSGEVRIRRAGGETILDSCASDGGEAVFLI
jgi:hypothetical protein